MVELIFAVYIIIESNRTQNGFGTPPAIVEARLMDDHGKNVVAFTVKINTDATVTAVNNAHNIPLVKIV